MSSQDIFGDEDSSDESEKETTPKPSNDVEMKDADASEDKKTEEKKAQKSAFDSDDDDESGGNKAPKETPNPDDIAKKVEKDPFAEEDSDDSDAKKKGEEDRKNKEKGSDEDNEDEVGGKQTSPQKDREGKKNDDDALEDSDDDDEPEFDDTGAVTGSSHNKGFQKKVSKKSALETLREQEEAEEAEARAADDDAPAKPLPPKVDPRTMVVLEPERPSSSTSIHITKLPNLIGIQPEAFDAATYSAKAEEEEYKGFVHDMIRWRYKKDNDGNMMRDEDGNLLRESNTRLVQWEDGSYTLHVGKEALVVDNIDSSQKIGPVDVVTGRTATFAGLNGYLYLSQVANFREPQKGEDDGDDVEGGFKETAAGTVLECVGAVGSRMTARPSSLRSEAHKNLTVAVRKKTIKRAQIAEIVTQYDPEKMKEERIRQQDGMAKEKARKKNYGDNYRSRARPRLGMTRDYLEDDYDDFDSTNLRAIKKRTMNAEEDDYDDGFIDYGDDDDDDEGTFNRKPRKRTKNRLDDSDDEDEAPAAEAASGKAAEEDKNDDDDDDDDDDDEVVTPVKSSKKRSHQAVFDDDDSD